MRMGFFLLAVIISGCAPLSRVRRLEYQNVKQQYAILEMGKYIQTLVDSNRLAEDRLKTAQVQMDIQHEQIKQALEIQAMYKPYADADKRRSAKQKKK